MWPEEPRDFPLGTGARLPDHTLLKCGAFKILWGRVVNYPPSFADSPSAGGWNSEFRETCRVTESLSCCALGPLGPCLTNTERSARCRRPRRTPRQPWAASSWKTSRQAGSEVSVLAKDTPPPAPHHRANCLAVPCQLFAPGVLS